jgi:hypothetical protein
MEHTHWNGDSWITRLKILLEEGCRNSPLTKGAAPEVPGLSGERGRPIEMGVQLRYEALRQGFCNSQDNP